jgi:hypothetical protein
MRSILWWRLCECISQARADESANWRTRAEPKDLLSDTLLACSIELRKKYIHYRELVGFAVSDAQMPPSALSLSVLTRTMNEDWDLTTEAWIREISEGESNVVPD